MPTISPVQKKSRQSVPWALALTLRRRTIKVLRQGLMLVQRHKLIVVFLFVAAYLVLQRQGELLSAPTIAPGEAQTRKLFPRGRLWPQHRD